MNQNVDNLKLATDIFIKGLVYSNTTFGESNFLWYRVI